MRKHEFRDYICEPFCVFYRAGDKEDLACGGALGVMKLVNSRALSPAVLSRLRLDKSTNFARNATLDTNICAGCPFFAADCDFQSDKEIPDAEPCGGYILLDMLLAEGLVSKEELVNCDDRKQWEA